MQARGIAPESSVVVQRSSNRCNWIYSKGLRSAKVVRFKRVLDISIDHCCLAVRLGEWGASCWIVTIQGVAIKTTEIGSSVVRCYFSWLFMGLLRSRVQLVAGWASKDYPRTTSWVLREHLCQSQIPDEILGSFLSRYDSLVALGSIHCDYRTLPLPSR